MKPDEARRIAPHWAAEGALLLVPPTGRGDLVLCPSVEAFIAAGGKDVSALAVAGVGSSALGSAAFARNVADAIGGPVVAVVSGYGLADLVTEALGGFFWFGTLNQLRHSFEILDKATKPSFIEGTEITGDFVVRRSLDTQAVLSLLGDERLSFDLLCGHSKGNLVISEALYELQELDPERTRVLAGAVKVVTVSALIVMPRPYTTVIDIMGDWDWFGRLNSPVGHCCRFKGAYGLAPHEYGIASTFAGYCHAYACAFCMTLVGSAVLAAAGWTDKKPGSDHRQSLCYR